MPEGDTIFRAARALNRALAGQCVVGFESAYAPLASVNDNTTVVGRTIESVESRGKWLLITFSGDLILVTHMLMSGSWHLYRQGERWHRGRSQMRVRIATETFEAVAFNVPVAKFHTAHTLERHSAIPKLGPDLLAVEFSTDDAAIRMRARPDEEIANVLLTQQVIAGIGNVFKSEICFACRVNPFRRVSSLTEDEVSSLIASARSMLAINVAESSGDSIVTYSGGRRTTGKGDPGSRLWVYGRQGRECRRCGSVILMRKQGTGARSTYWCPECQPVGDKNSAQVEGWASPVLRRKIGCG